MKLLIENFYNIKHAELDFKKFNILIGPQAAGKSLIAKVLYFFEETVISYELGAFTGEKLLDSTTASNKATKLFKSIFEKETLQTDFSLELYSTEGTPYVFNSSGLNLSDRPFISKKDPDLKDLTSINKKIFHMANFITKMEKATRDEAQKLEKLKAFNHIKNLFMEALQETNAMINQGNFFIPASRSLVNIINDNSFWMKENNIDYFLTTFGQAYTRQIKKLTNTSPLLCDKLKQIIKGQVEQTEYGYAINDGKNSVSLANASSGQQATLPIIIGLNKVAEKKIFNTYIEEPEAHIFPEAQYLLTRYISEIHNQTGTNITLTTHSPYILTAVNNLIYAGTVGKQSEEKAAKVKELIPEDQWLNSEDVAAYMVKADGTVRSIMDEESGLIDADSIDSVSDKIGVEFDKIFDIEFNKEASDA